MILFILFLSFWLGLTISSAYIALSSTALVFLLFVLKRFKIRLFVLSVSFLFLGIIVSFIRISFPKSEYEGVIYQTSDNYFLLNSGGERLYVAYKNHPYDIGDIISIKGEKKSLSFTRIESSFDFENYLNKRGVYSSLDIKNCTVKFHNPIRINERRDQFLSRFPSENSSVIGAILFSDGGESEINATMKDLHLARFLSASGIFVSAFYFALTHLFNTFLKDKWARLMSLGFLSLYSVFTFPRFSVTKVMFFLIIRWINEFIFKKKFSYLTLLSFLGFFCLCLNPFLARQDSFILGFLIPIISYLTRYIFRKKKIKHFFFRYFIIYLFFLPFEIAYYNKIVIFSLPIQIIISPLMMVIGVVSLLCFFYVPIYQLDNFLLMVLKWFVNLIKPLTIGLLLPAFNEGLMLVYYAIYTLWLFYLGKGFVPIYRTLLLMQVSIVCLFLLPIENTITNEVNFINVGQGDCTLIRNHNKVALIDTGGLTYMDVANSSLIPYLRKKRIYKIDTVFITHYDYDHYGALEELSKTYSIKNIYDYTSTYPVKMGDVTFHNHNYYANSDEENDKSLVISFNICQKDFVIMGDAPMYIEKEIIKHNDPIECDILKVGHHGSNTSTSEEWIKYLTPSEAIVSCGKNNKFGHPNKEVVAVLNKYKITIHRTDMEGTIVYKQLSIN